MAYIDLHAHTTYSDGALTPAAMVARAQAAGVGVLAIADHDLVGGSLAAAPLCREAGITLIPACEVTTLLEGFAAHVLAYLPRLDDPGFLDLIAYSRARLDGMSETLIRRMKADFPALDEAELRAYPERRDIGGWKALYYLAEKGAAASPLEALPLYQRYGVAYAEAGFPDARQALAAIAAAGGKAVLAHPGATFGDDMERMTPVALDMGFDGAECAYVYHDAAQTAFLKRLVASRGLIETTGSDDHGGFSGAMVGSLKIEVESMPSAWYKELISR